MAKGIVKAEYLDIVKLFGSLTGSKSMWQVFNDVITVIALTIQNTVVMGRKYKKNEDEYKRIVSEYTRDEVEKIVEIFGGIVKMAEENPFRDLLGDLYMQLEMGSSAMGQFFTPYAVSQAMAENSYSVEDMNAILNEKNYITLYEPAVGGGANIIAFCEYLHKNDINYQDKCFVVCQELSRLTALMCYIVLSLIGCSAVIKVGDTLADSFTNYFDEVAKGSELWVTPMFIWNGGMYKV
jgi:type I restriction-modification system DNA methylase subunit